MLFWLASCDKVLLWLFGYFTHHIENNSIERVTRKLPLLYRAGFLLYQMIGPDEDDSSVKPFMANERKGIEVSMAGCQYESCIFGTPIISSIIITIFCKLNWI